MKTRQGRRFKMTGTAMGFVGCMVVGLLWGRGETSVWLCFIPAILLHELGHLLVARLCHAHVGGLKIDLLGARIAIDGMVSYPTEFFIAMGGPLANLVIGGVAYGLWGKAVLPGEGWQSLFFMSSMALAVFNLLPVGTMDGGRMLAAALSYYLNPTVAYVVLKITTAVFLLCLWLLSTYALLMGAGMMSLFVFSLCLLCRLLSADPATGEV